MSVKLKLQPFSAIASQTKDITFVVSGLDSSKKYRIFFENASLHRAAKVVSSEKGIFVGDRLSVSNTESVSGKIDLSVHEVDNISVASIYANIEEQTESDSWRLSDIAAFSFQIENSTKKTSADKVSVYPPFVGLQQKATIKVNSEPNSNLHVSINSKRFVIKTNFSGEGTFSFRAIDILGGSLASSTALQKFHVTYYKPQDNYKEAYDSGVFVHFVPKSMKALQATNDPEAPECAILDPIPGEGLTLQKLDDFCLDGPVVGSLSVFDADDESSAYYSSKVGFCTEPKQIYPGTADDALCRIYNSTDSTSLHNGAGLVVFASQETFANEETPAPNLASRVFVANIPSSLKYSGNPVRNGTILKPPAFYHTATPGNVSVDDKYSLTFRIDDSTLFEIQYTSLQGIAAEVVSSFVALINNSDSAVQHNIIAVDQGTYIEVKSATRFSMRSTVLVGNGTLDVQLKSNKTLELLTEDKALTDSGNTIVFLFPRVGYQSHTIVSRDAENKIIRFEVPSGFNNDIGPTITENYYCQQFIVVDTNTELAATDLVGVSPLPYIYDIYNREVPSVYPVIATKKTDTAEFAYVVCQAPVNGVYQLFFFSFRVGEEVENLRWKQLTSGSENKNAKLKCDSVGNLHLVWESDRMGPTQVYYSVLGQSSRSISNAVLMSVLDKNISQGTGASLLQVSDPTTSIQDDWTRILQGDGRVSVYDRKYVAVEGNPSEDAAMAFFSLSKDEFGNDISWNFGHLSYQISFEFWMPSPEDGVLEEPDIQSKYNEWKAEFNPVGDYKYEKDGNFYTIDFYEPFYENLIPICGSYKLNPNDMTLIAGGLEVSDVPHRGTGVYADFDTDIKLSQPSNIKHFMLAMIPEKIRFKAKNFESFTQYCERLGVSSQECEGFNNEINYEINTGKYKLALLVSTSENTSSGEIAKKNYKITRFLSGYIDFNDPKQLKVAVHYAKNGSDEVANVAKRERQSSEDDYRFSGDIIVTVDDSPVFATSFLADFSDQYRQFDIGLGIPPGQGIVIDESTPFKGNMFENDSFKQVFADIDIGSHSMSFNPDYYTISSFDRDTSEMVVIDKVVNILENGGFEETVLPYADATEMFDGYQGVTDWTVGYGSVYRRSISADSSVSSWMELTGLQSGLSILKGYVTTTITTIPGKTYYVFFDISNHVDSYLQGTSITKKVKVTAGPTIANFSINTRTGASLEKPNWKTRTLSFTAISSSTALKFENSSTQFDTVKDIQYGPQIDKVIVISEDDLNDELHSFTTAESLMVDQDEFDLNYSLNAVDDFTQLPVTVSLDYQNKVPDIILDKIDKAHLAWQSNRNQFWDIYYSGFRSRNEPFRHDIRITNSESVSINPCIAVDCKGRRLIAWQDNRNGQNQIYAALSKAIDSKLLDNCKQDEVDEFIYNWNKAIDPYLDPNLDPMAQLNCAIEFSFTAPTSDLYHFNLLFYEDRERTIPLKTITSKTSIDGWKVNNEQLEYNGLDAAVSTVYNISYLPSYNDDISGKVVYMVVEFEVNSIPVDFNNSVNLKMLQPYNGLNLGISRTEDSLFRAMVEFDDLAPVAVSPQTASYINSNSGLFTGLTFDSPLKELPGFEKGDKIKTVLLHFDPIGTSGSVISVIKFTSPIIAIFPTAAGVVAGNDYFAAPGVTYPNFSVIGLESFDTIQISSDRKTLTITSFVNPSMDEVRVVLADNAEIVDQTQFVYYCPTKQSERCDISCGFVNNTSINKILHFRVTFYTDAEKTHSIMSSFTKNDTLNWISGSSAFPVSGLVVEPGQSINAIYTPEVVPFELYESQNSHTFSNSIVRQPLLCGATYHAVVESYRDGVFFVENEFSFTCPCSETKSDTWNKETDSLTWICSGQGFEDYRISLTDNQCLSPRVATASFDLFYIVWRDLRYSRIQSNQLPLSPDCFMGMYNSETDEFICSGQGGYDRRVTNFSTSGLVLYNVSIFVDPFQNLNLAMHDGSKVYSQTCSLGCKFTAQNTDLVLPCMFTDETDSTFFVMGDFPERTTEQYQKIRVSEKYVAFSTYLDLRKPIPVVNDCFLEFNIIGVPGTYAYRLRNENDEEWSEWLPIGPNLPVQTQTDEASTEQERDFFRGYFTQRDVFVAPWVVSAGNGLKRVCCEVLTFFGKTSTFCIDFMAIYDNLEYKIDLYFDSDFTQPVPKYKNYMVVSEYKTETVIDDTNLTSIKETPSQVSTIYARIEFKDKRKITLIEKLQTVSRFNYLDPVTISVYQQGINDQLSLPLERISDGIYRGSFTVEADDGVVNVDGLAIIVVDIPGQCKKVSFSELSQRAETLETTRTLDQQVSVFNDFTLFRDQYTADDIKGSFGNPNYYKVKKFGISSIFNNSPAWIGAGPGPVGRTTSSVDNDSGGSGSGNGNLGGSGDSDTSENSGGQVG